MGPFRVARWLLAVGAFSMLAVGCGDDPQPTPTMDTGAADTATTDITGDTSAGDTGSPQDTGVAPDTATTDTGTPPADTTPEDTATVDSETPDTGTPDLDTGVDVPPVDVIVEDVSEDTGADTRPADAAECTTSTDCASSTGGPVCDTSRGRCVRCTTAEDVCPTGNRCDPTTNTCVMGCRTAADCAAGQSCDTATRTCTGCTSDESCAPGTICRSGTCVAGCSPARPCGAGSTCCGSTCVNTDTDGMNCGACGTACGAGSTCCSGRCATTGTDPRNCGACGTSCSAMNGVAGCAAGACTVASCNAGFANCDGNAANGCEVDTNVSATHCGRCDNACPGGTGATGRCDRGTCGLACAAGRGNCDGDATNGCETDLNTTVTRCGACGTSCPTRTNADPTCVGGACGFTCSAGFANCDGSATNGCETDTRSSATNCGACGRRCTFANATPVCRDSACALGACATGFGNCDSNATNGCEVTLLTDRNNCGGCGVRCDAGEVCSAGACSRVCTSPLAFCGGTCVSTQTDAANCGACGTRCASGSNSASSCVSGACQLTCVRGFGNCDAVATNGCEINLTNTLTHCGVCGNTCRFTNAAATCSGGACALGACTTGFGNCDANPTNGCETDLRTDAGNCGTCGRVCSFANAAATCTGSTCALGACNANFGNCNGSAADGCETDLRTDPRHCGRCGVACGAGTACAAGACVSSCPTATTFCGGACVDLQTSRTNCGRCGNICPAGQVCAAGTCGAPVPSNDTCAGATALSLAASSFDFTATNVNANHNVDIPCLTRADGADVFYRFTLTRRELVYADTFGTTRDFDTVLFLMTGTPTSCTAPISESTTPGDQVCNDDSSTVTNGCAETSYASHLMAVLNPGTYYLVVSGYATATGTTSVHFEHLPVGNGTLNLLPSGASVQTGTTTGTGVVSSATCGGSGPENTYWWRTCPGAGAGAFVAETCATATFDTVLYVANGNAFGDACNDDGCGAGLTQSRVTTSIGSVARLHALHVDGFGNASGTYTVRITRP